MFQEVSVKQKTDQKLSSWKWPSFCLSHLSFNFKSERNSPT